MKLAEISIKRAILAAMMIAALMVFGFFSFPRIGVELFPNVEFPVITTTVIYPGADPTTMESKVAEPIEEAVQGISGIKRLTSRNLEGVTQVIIVCINGGGVGAESDDGGAGQGCHIDDGLRLVATGVGDGVA